MALAAIKLLEKATALKSGDALELTGKNVHRTYQAELIGVAPCAADVQIEVSLNKINWMVLGHITLSDTNGLIDGFADNAAWLYTRATLATLTGTGASVDVYMGY